MVRWLAAFLGMSDVVNGLVMLAAPTGWASVVPGVAERGPVGPHFVQDVGAAFVSAGAGLLARAVHPAWWPAAATGSVFLGIHAALHLGEALTGDAPTPAADLLLVVAPAALSVLASLPARRDARV